MSHVVVYFPSGARVRAEVARGQGALARGLSGRAHLQDDFGMVFDMGETARHLFWMRDTLVSLDIVFLAEDGTVVGVVTDAAPLDLTPRGVAAESRYVLEVPGGWCARNRVAVGQRAVVVAIPTR